ncbi:MAG: DNRLRE domain-containing protein [Akkermansiaceae bacterium]|nr:DNRLRE domain-containing protein [Akkermansiaceae bacterium]
MAYEIWYFPREQGKLVSVVKNKPDNPDDPHKKPIIHHGDDALTPIADSHVYAYNYRNWNLCNLGAYEILGAGHSAIGGDKRTYLKFDLSRLAIPSGQRVKLRLFHYHTGGRRPGKLAIYPVTSAWKEGRGTYHSGSMEQIAPPGEISWVRQPSINWKPAATFQPDTVANKFIEVDVTDLIKSWKAGQANHGMVIAPVRNEGGANLDYAFGFYSREYKDADKRPALVIGTSTNTGNTVNTGNTNGDDPPPPPPTGALQVRAGHKQIKKDQTFHLPVWLDFPKTFPRTRDGRINVANLNIEIHYNPNVIRAGSTTLKGNILGNALFQANSRQAGVIKLGFATKKGIMLSGTLAQLPFQAVGQPGQRSPVSIKVTTVNDDKGRSPQVKVVHGYVQILNKAVIGDINGNGIIDAGDALSALKMSVGLIPQDLILNIDQKDQVTSNDARLLLKKAVQGGGTVPQTPTPATTTSNQKTPPNVANVTSADAKRAYQEYIAAYNKMTSLMAKGQGDTPAAQQAYAAYKAAKDRYEAALKTGPAVK